MTPQIADDVHLQAVYVLILVDQHVVEALGELRADHLVRRERAPIQKQVVEIDHAKRLLTRRICLEESCDCFGVLLTPRKQFCDQLAQATLAVDRSRVDLKQRALLGKAGPALRMTVLLSKQVEDVGGVTGVEQAEPRGQAERGRVLSDELVRDRVKGAAQDPTTACRDRDHRSTALEHFACRPAGEGEQQDPLGRCTGGDEPRHARTKGRRFSRPGAGQDQERAAGVPHRSLLLWVQLGEPALGDGRRRGVVANRRAGLTVEHSFGQ